MFQDKIAVITGGARGIGRATAEAFRRAGATACVIDDGGALGRNGPGGSDYHSPPGNVMELGLTFPLQRFLKRRPPVYGTMPDRRFCWDLHVIDLRGRRCLLAVHCHSRYAFVRYDVAPLQWGDLPRLFREGLTGSLAAAGFAPERVEEYLRQAGAPAMTRTHGRREVAFLNRAWEDVLALDLCLDVGGQAQPLLDRAVNARPSRCVGFEGLGTGLERMAVSLCGPSAPPASRG